MLEQNLRYLEKKDTQLYIEIKVYIEENFKKKRFIIAEGNKGFKHLETVDKDSKVRIHSAYDPIREAEAWVLKYKDSIEASNSLCIFGAGLGYHIELIKSLYPNKILYVYEPSAEIFSYYVQMCHVQGVKGFFVGSFKENRSEIVSDVFKKSSLILDFPPYADVFSEEYKNFLDQYKNFLKEKRENRAIVAAFQTRWIGNTILNFKKTMKSPYFIQKNVFEYFRNKTVLIVSAGPSLTFEIENLRKIKQEGTAYIFAVGSAIHVLLENGIKPDAIFSFDPSYKNFEQVFKPFVDRGLSEIPLVYGTTIGYEVLQNYKGKQAHFHVNRGGIAALLFKIRQEEITLDSPTIAAVLLQILIKLNVKNIIFVGQNLAYFDEKIYADEVIHYKNQVVNHTDLTTSILVKSVEGKDLKTTQGFLAMKNTIETFIVLSGRKDIINTTKNGAHIEHTVYMPLCEVIESKLTERIVDENWFEDVVENSFTEEKQRERLELIMNQYKELTKQKKLFYKRMQKIQETLTKIEKALKSDHMKRVMNLFSIYDDHMMKVEKNLYYNSVIMPVIESVLQKESDRAKILFEQGLSVKKLNKEKCKLLINVMELIMQTHNLMDAELQPIEDAIEEEKKNMQI